MEALILLVLLVALGLLANRHGDDSRPQPRSPAEHLSRLGHAWSEVGRAGSRGVMRRWWKAMPCSHANCAE